MNAIGSPKRTGGLPWAVNGNYWNVVAAFAFVNLSVNVLNVGPLYVHDLSEVIVGGGAFDWHRKMEGNWMIFLSGKFHHFEHCVRCDGVGFAHVIDGFHFTRFIRPLHLKGLAMMVS